MKNHKQFGMKGLTLIELLIGLVLCGMVGAGIYRVFIAQSKAYTVQDQVVEVQQSVRSAMEILLRDLRMAGYDNDNLTSTITINNPIAAPLKNDAITVDYEYYDNTTSEYQKHTVAYWRDASLNLIRKLTVNDVPRAEETLLGNVEELNFTYYGVDVNENGALDDVVSEGDTETSKVIAVRVTLKARPLQVNPDVQRVSPRELVSTITLRNLCFSKGG